MLNLHFKKAILIVDDNVDSAELLSRALSRYGYKSLVAHTACEGLRVHAEQPDIGIVFADLQLEGSMNGREMAVIMMEREPRTIVYALTGHADKFHLDDCLRVGFKDYFTKPIRIKSLMSVVDCSMERLNRWEQLV